MAFKNNNRNLKDKSNEMQRKKNNRIIILIGWYSSVTDGLHSWKKHDSELAVSKISSWLTLQSFFEFMSCICINHQNELN